MLWHRLLLLLQYVTMLQWFSLSIHRHKAFTTNELIVVTRTRPAFDMVLGAVHWPGPSSSWCLTGTEEAEVTLSIYHNSAYWLTCYSVRAPS